ncbi:MAG: response regulator transcription factor [Chloroflexi bacterium]|nr:response regulator transcription factor [Chloroflexota bacterium]
MMNVRVLVIGDDPLARTGLARLLEGRETIVVAGQLAPSSDLLEDAALYQADVWLWDLGWDAEAVPADLAEAETPVVALLPDDSLAADALAAGVRALLFREAGVETLCRAIEAVVEGLLVLDPALLGALQAVMPRSAEPPPVEALTAREQEVLQLLAEGLSNRAIAHALTISEHTVKFHVNAIMTKLNAQSRTEAVVRATRLGLLLL